MLQKMGTPTGQPKNSSISSFSWILQRKISSLSSLAWKSTHFFDFLFCVEFFAISSHKWKNTHFFDFFICEDFFDFLFCVEFFSISSLTWKTPHFLDFVICVEFFDFLTPYLLPIGQLGNIRLKMEEFASQVWRGGDICKNRWEG